MNCLKCGRETENEQVFCQDCLLEMQKYPVRPGTAIMLPKHREASAARKSTKRRSVSAEDQLRALKKRCRILSMLLALALLLAALLAVPAWQHLAEERLRPGQNYTAIPSITVPTVVETTAD